MGRSPPCCGKDGLKKGPWMAEEDQKLLDYIRKHGYGNWRTLPKNAGLQRCGKSCRLRWTNYLRPDIKRGRFSFEEEETIIQLHSILGNKWSAIAARLPGRTDNEIKNYWNTHIRKRLLRMGINPVTHTPQIDHLDLNSILYNPSQINISRLLQIQPFITPDQLLNLATASSLMASQNDRQNPYNIIPQSIDQNQLIFNPQIQNPIPQRDQEIQPTHDGHQTRLMEEMYAENCYPSHVDANLYQDNNPVPDLSSYNEFLYGSNPRPVNHMDRIPTETASTFSASNQNVSLNSVFSTPSSSPTPFNSNATYLTSTNCTEDERESYELLDHILNSNLN